MRVKPNAEQLLRPTATSARAREPDKVTKQTKSNRLPRENPWKQIDKPAAVYLNEPTYEDTRLDGSSSTSNSDAARTVGAMSSEGGARDSHNETVQQPFSRQFPGFMVTDPTALLTASTSMHGMEQQLQQMQLQQPPHLQPQQQLHQPQPQPHQHQQDYSRLPSGLSPPRSGYSPERPGSASQLGSQPESPLRMLSLIHI